MRALPILPLLILAACGPKTPPQGVEAQIASYALRAADATVKPEGLASIMTDYYDARLLLTLAGPVQGPLQVLLAPAKPDGTQDLCAVTTLWSGVTVDATGAFQVQGAALNLSVDGDPSQLSDVTVVGQRPATGAPLLLSQVSGRLDTRPYLPLMGKNLPPDSLCAMLPMLGPCVPCPSGDSETCWNLELSGISAAPATGLVVPRDRSAICSDPACASAKICGAAP